MPSFSLYQLLLVIGIIQGFITCFLLFFSKHQSLSKKLLGFTIAIFCLVSLRKLLGSLGVFNAGPLRYIPLGYELFLPPLVYLYTLSLIESQFKLLTKHLWFFVPAAIYFIYDLVLFLRVLPLENTIDKDLLAIASFYSPINQIEDYLILVLTVVFLAIGKIKLNAYKNKLKELNVDETDPIYLWIKSVFRWMIVLAVILSVNILLNAIPHFDNSHDTRWKLFNVFLSFSIYYLGFMGYKKEDTLLYKNQKALISRSHKFNHDHIIALAHQLKQKLEKEQAYLDPNMSINQLAQQLDTTAENISFVVNKKFDQSFRDFINTYRIAAAKAMLLDENTQSSILDIALASGFNSQASFYRAFKKFTDMSPKAFQSQKQGN